MIGLPRIPHMARTRIEACAAATPHCRILLPPVTSGILRGAPTPRIGTQAPHVPAASPNSHAKSMAEGASVPPGAHRAPRLLPERPAPPYTRRNRAKNSTAKLTQTKNGKTTRQNRRFRKGLRNRCEGRGQFASPIARVLQFTSSFTCTRSSIWIECLATDQEVGGSSPFGYAI
jgi:hypothetical protein